MRSRARQIMIIARPGPGLAVDKSHISRWRFTFLSPWEKGQFGRQIVLMLIITSYYIYTSIFVTLEFIRYETSWKHLMNFTERKYSFNAPNDQMELSVGEWM